MLLRFAVVNSAVTVWATQKLAGFGSIFMKKLRLCVRLGLCLHILVLYRLETDLKARIPFDNELLDYHLTSVEIMLLEHA